MKKLLIAFFLIINVFSVSYKIHYYPESIRINDVNINKFLEVSKVPKIRIVIIEAENINQFTQLTKKEYTYYSAVTTKHRDEYIIITQPFHILKQRNIFEDTIEHEIFHVYFNNFYNLSKIQQESLIHYFTDERPDEYFYNAYYKRFLKDLENFGFNIFKYLNHYKKWREDNSSLHFFIALDAASKLMSQTGEKGGEYGKSKLFKS